MSAEARLWVLIAFGWGILITLWMMLAAMKEVKRALDSLSEAQRQTRDTIDRLWREGR